MWLHCRSGSWHHLSPWELATKKTAAAGGAVAALTIHFWKLPLNRSLARSIVNIFPGQVCVGKAFEELCRAPVTGHPSNFITVTLHTRLATNFVLGQCLVFELCMLVVSCLETAPAVMLRGTAASESRESQSGSGKANISARWRHQRRKLNGKECASQQLSTCDGSNFEMDCKPAAGTLGGAAKNIGLQIFSRASKHAGVSKTFRQRARLALSPAEPRSLRGHVSSWCPMLRSEHTDVALTAENRA